MIRPHKYLDLNLSILNLGGVILSELKAENYVRYDELLNRIVLKWGDNAKEVFKPTLCFLFVLGKIKYHKDIDTIEFLK